MKILLTALVVAVVALGGAAATIGIHDEEVLDSVSFEQGTNVELDFEILELANQDSDVRMVLCSAHDTAVACDGCHVVPLVERYAAVLPPRLRPVASFAYHAALNELPDGVRLVPVVPPNWRATRDHPLIM